MIINTTPDNIAILGNVSNIGEFRIKNSSKAFSILSSGLYANKIRAIIRELSCNAYDSHIAAGKKETPFDLHLPTVLEPYFYIRDYGTGLTHDQVVNIYTTYFESTKTNSNDFIGALGLGSKSPFSYTDNFTVTAIKDGIKGIYSAFINESGVPSIALMSTSQTDESNGVEVKFAVDISNDYEKFKNETKYVLKHFHTKPNILGTECTIPDIHYVEIDVIPGINIIDNGGKNSIAVMGNIPYPIDVPNKESNLGNLADLLNKSLEIRFEIGELDFQASREGLSYTKPTIQAIKNRLQSLQDKLDSILENEANTYTNIWECAKFLRDKYDISLWQNSVKNYANKTKVKNLIDFYFYSTSYQRILFTDEILESKYNLKINGIISPCDNTDPIAQIKQSSHYDHKSKSYINAWDIRTVTNVHFIKYPKFRGGLEHVKTHYKSISSQAIYKSGTYVYILSPVVQDNPALFDEFFNDIYNPPKNVIFEIGDLIEKPKANRIKYEYTPTALRLKISNKNKSGFIWEPIGDISNYDKNKNYYYIPLSGFVPISLDGYPLSDVKSLFNYINNCGIAELSSIPYIYGIRKADIESVKKMPNWINLQEHIISVINMVKTDSLVGSYAKSKLDSNVFNSYRSVYTHIDDKNNLYCSFMKKCNNQKSFDVYSLEYLCKVYSKNISPQQFIDKIKLEMDQFISRYPLLQNISYRAKPEHIAQYINLIDKTTTLETI